MENKTTQPSWRARLARSNINILSVTPDYWVYEFTYHPRPGTFKWCKTVHEVVPTTSLEELRSGTFQRIAYGREAEAILSEVLSLRKELEGDNGSKR